MMSPWLRKLVLIIHLTLSVGWVGAVAAYLTSDVTASTSEGVAELRAAYLSMQWMTWWVIVPLAFGSVATGLILSLGTPWGLFRHYWVVISLIATLFALVVLLLETRTIDAYAGIAADPTTSDARLRDLGGTLLHSVGGTVVLLVVLGLNVYKPKGLTKYGRRKRREERLS